MRMAGSASLPSTASGSEGLFHGALAYIGSVALLGVASYLFIIGDVHRLPAEG